MNMINPEISFTKPNASRKAFCEARPIYVALGPECGHVWWFVISSDFNINKNSSGDEIANDVNFL